LATAIKATVATGLSALIGIGGYLAWAWNHSLAVGTDTYVVRPGMSMHGFARQLYERGVLPDRYSLVLLAYLKGQPRSLKAGEYRFPSGITQRGLLDQVYAGKVVEYPLVLIEGLTFDEMLAEIHSASKIESTLDGLTHDQIMARLGRPDVHPEGEFYPDTYYYSAGTTDVNLLRRAFDRMQARLQAAWAGRAPGLPFATPYQALTLASIVEKETGRADERQLIAGVFINRLQRGMRLQSDPTVIYGMGTAFDGNLRRRDLEHDTPYSTYTRSGLPPTPIAMPGGESLNAVMHPAPTKALYFVARGDGTHQFSETLQEHNEAVIKYQLHGKRSGFSSYKVAN
jgi:UPF0755 protein